MSFLPLLPQRHTLMNISDIYKQFPSQQDCITHLEKIRWNSIPKCPYCNSTNQTRSPKESRYHCNNCNTSFSVTVGTIFHKTKADLQKWFLAIFLTLNGNKDIASRKLARDLCVTKDTAWRMLTRIRGGLVEQHDLLESVVGIQVTLV